MRNRLLSSLLVCLLAFSLFSVAGSLAFGAPSSGTYVNGDITSNTTWTREGSPYVFTGDVNVTNPSATLTISEGTTVDLNGYTLALTGRLMCCGNGTWSNVINGGNRRALIDLLNSMPENTCPEIGNTRLNNVNIHVGGSFTSLEYNQISFGSIVVDGGAPLIIGNNLTDCSLQISSLMGAAAQTQVSGNTFTNSNIAIVPGLQPQQYQLTINNNVIKNNGLYGIELNNSYADILGNAISGSQYGILSIDGYPSIQDNGISNCQTGILLSSSPDPQDLVYMGTTDPIIENNLITHNVQGVEVALSAKLFMSLNPYTSNIHYVGTVGFGILSNTISDNSVAMYLSYSNGTASITSWATQANATVYNSLTAIEYNNFENNTKSNLYLSNTPNNIEAADNYWGTTNTKALTQTIYDNKDNSSLGAVTFTPFLKAANSKTYPSTANSGIQNLLLWIAFMVLAVIALAILDVLLARKRKSTRVSEEASEAVPAASRTKELPPS